MIKYRNVAFLCVWLLLGTAGATATSRSIRGTVTTTDGMPIANASVVLRTDRTDRPQYGTLTAKDGTFSLRDVANGRYRFVVQKEGYLPWTAQAKPKWPSSDVILDFAEGSIDREFHIQLTRASSISGRVSDENGNPIIGAEVRVYKALNFFGERRFRSISVPGSYLQTNDLGQYRAYGLPPGKYYVAASYSRHIVALSKQLRFDQSSTPDQYVPTFFPGVTDPTAATPIEITPENDARGVDFSMTANTVARITGKVTGCALTSPSEAGITLSLRIPGISEPLLQIQGRVKNADGDFEISGVPHGSYELNVYISGRNQSSMTTVPVEVGIRDLADVVVSCPMRIAVHGIVKIDGATNLSGTPRFMLQSLGRPGTGYSAQIKRDGTFEFYDFLPGKYRVQVEPLPDTFFLESAKLGARDVLQEGIEVEGTISESLQIVLSDKAAALNGAVWDDDQKPIPGALVVLIPRTRTREELYVASTTADNGSFQMLRLTPGDYDAYAWRYSDAIESYRDPDFLAKYLARRTPLHLEPGAVSNISLQVLPEK